MTSDDLATPRQVRYAAFISYSHTDETDARWLHRHLESYRTPKPLIGQQGRFGAVRNRVGKVFRDREEFAAGGELKQEIEAALRESEALIVLCSPAASTSLYVNAEIAYFIGLGRADRIVPVILSGDPAQCFPAALNDDRERLGADFREGKDGRDAGSLKLLAGLIGVGLDELVQREAVAQRWRLRAVTGLASLFLVLSVAAGWFAFDADRNGREAAEQRDAAFSALGRTFADRAWGAISGNDHALAAKYALSGARLAPRYQADFRTVAARIAFDVPQSEIWGTPARPILQVVFSNDHNYAALAFDETHGDQVGNICEIREIATRQIIRRIEDCFRLHALQSRDGGLRLLTSSSRHREGGPSVDLWDVRTGTRLGGASAFPHLPLTLFADGETTMLSITGEEFGVRFVNLVSGEETWRVTQPTYGRMQIVGDLLALDITAPGRAQTDLWSLTDHRRVATLPSQYSELCRADDRLFALTERGDARVDVWRIGASAPESSWTSDLDGSFAFSENCETVGAHDYDPGPAGVWNARTGRSLLRVPAQGGFEQRLSLSPDGDGVLVWSVSPDSVSGQAAPPPTPARAFAVQSGQELNELRGHTANLEDVNWNGSAGFLTTDISGYAIYRGALSPRWALNGELGGVPSAIGGDGENIILFGITTDAVRRFALTPLHADQTHELVPISASRLAAVAVTQRGDLVAGVGVDGAIGIWRASDTAQQREVPGDGRSGEIVLFSEDARRIVAGDTTGGVRVVDVATGRITATFAAPRERVRDGAITRNGWVWGDDNRNNLAITRDGAIVATAVDSMRVRLWNASTGEERAPIETPSRVNSVAFSRDGAQLLVGGADGALRIFDIGSRALRTTLMVRSAAVTDVAVSDNGVLYATGSSDGGIIIWDAASMREIVRLQGNAQKIELLEFSTDGESVLSVDENGGMRLWLIPHLDNSFEDLSAYLCGELLNDRARAFSPDEATGNVLISDIWLAGNQISRDVCEGIEQP